MIAIKFKVVDAAGPLAEFSLSEKVLVLQEKCVHSSLDMIIANVSQGFGLNNCVNYLDVVGDILDGIEILMSKETPLQKNKERRLKV